MKIRLLIGFVIGLVLSITCNADYDLARIAERIRIGEEIMRTDIPQILKDASAINTKFSSISTSTISQARLKAALNYLSDPLNCLAEIEVDIITTDVMLNTYRDQHPNVSGDQIEPFRAKLAKLQAELKNIKEHHEDINNLYAKIVSLKQHAYYSQLASVDIDHFGLSKNVAIPQIDKNSCAVHVLFNFFRNCPSEDLGVVVSNSSRQARAILDNILRNRGNPVALRGVVNGTEPDCLWGMAQGRCSFIDTRIGRIMASPDKALLEVLSEFNLTFDIQTQAVPTSSLGILGAAEISKMLSDLPSGNYIISLKYHAMFLKKVNDEISIYDSGYRVLLEDFAFSFDGEEAIALLADLSSKAHLLHNDIIPISILRVMIKPSSKSWCTVQ